MNKCIFSGRLTTDPQIRATQDGKYVGNYTIAVNRRYNKDAKEGDQTADFPRLVVFGKAAEFAEKYLHKGTKVNVVARVQTGSYTDKDGKKVYTTDFVVEDQEFAESKNSGATPQQTQSPAQDQGFIPIPDADDEELPFD